MDHKGVVFAWGANNLRQTGISDERGGKESLILAPTIVDALTPEKHGGSKVVQIAGGSDHTLFLFDDGQVWGCGLVDPQSPRIGLADDHPRMAQALNQIEELTAQRDAVQAESGFEAAMEQVPSVRAFIVEPACLTFPPAGPEEEHPTKIAKIASSGRCNLAVDVRGHLYAWGEGNSCQLGLGDTAAAMEVKTPVRVKNTALENYMAIDISLGAQHALISCVTCILILPICTYYTLLFCGLDPAYVHASRAVPRSIFHYAFYFQPIANQYPSLGSLFRSPCGDKL